MVGALGISLQPYMTGVAALGVGLAGLAGVLLAPISGVHPAMGAEILTAAFVVVVIGGLGSFWGVILAAGARRASCAASRSTSSRPPARPRSTS
jgi:branched-chain amino acid transport system permease protein